SSQGDEITIGATKPFVRNWVANHYVTRIERACRAEGIEPASISIVLVSEKPQVAGGVMRTVSLPQPPVNVSYLHPHSEPKDDEPRGLWNRMLHPAQPMNSATALHVPSPKARTKTSRCSTSMAGLASEKRIF